jgi:hypothetical protein
LQLALKLSVDEQEFRAQGTESTQSQQSNSNSKVTLSTCRATRTKRLSRLITTAFLVAQTPTTRMHTFDMISGVISKLIQADLSSSPTLAFGAVRVLAHSNLHVCVIATLSHKGAHTIPQLLFTSTRRGLRWVGLMRSKRMKILVKTTL